MLEILPEHLAKLNQYQDKIRVDIRKQFDKQKNAIIKEHIQKRYADAMELDQQVLENRVAFNVMEDAGLGMRPETDFERGAKAIAQIMKAIATRILGKIGFHIDPAPWGRQSDYDIRQNLSKSIERDGQRAETIRTNARTEAENVLKIRGWRPKKDTPEILALGQRSRDALKLTQEFPGLPVKDQREILLYIEKAQAHRAVSVMQEALANKKNDSVMNVAMFGNDEPSEPVAPEPAKKKARKAKKPSAPEMSI